MHRNVTCAADHNIFELSSWVEWVGSPKIQGIYYIIFLWSTRSSLGLRGYEDDRSSIFFAHFVPIYLIVPHFCPHLCSLSSRVQIRPVLVRYNRKAWFIGILWSLIILLPFGTILRLIEVWVRNWHRPIKL
jgi:hypothetical protein